MDDPGAEEPHPPDTAAQARAAELLGKVISGRYRVDRLLAMGGMGAVYEGHHRALKKRVAVKVLRPETDNLPEMLARFEREAIAGAHVVHPNVAAATDFGQLEDGSYFLVMEYVSGDPLHHVIARGPLPPARAANIARQIAAALHAAHVMGIVHRDVKPRNIMLVEGRGDLAKLIDFGLAKVPVDRVLAQQSVRPPAASLHDGGAVPRAPRRPRFDSIQDSKPRLTGVGMIVGTVAYLAPEAALGMDAVDARADLYALGLVLYQMLAGRHPWDADNDAALFTHQRLTPPPPFAERAPGLVIPPALEAVVMKLLAKSPADRPPTGAAVIEALDAAMAPPAPPPPPPWGFTLTATGVRPYLPVLIGAASIALGVAAALAFNGASAGPRPSPPPARAAAASPAPAPAAAPPPPAPAAPSAPPSAAPPTLAAAITTATPESDAPTRVTLLRAIRVRDWTGGEAAFLGLAAHDPAAFRAPDLSLAARELAVALERDHRGDRIFAALAGPLGTDGLDVLYDLVATRGKAAAALRAADVLRKRDVLAQATPALRIAFELREAPCVDKLGLLDRAVAEGDGRALVVLQTQGVACFRKNNRAVLTAMASLRSRLHKVP